MKKERGSLNLDIVGHGDSFLAGRKAGLFAE